MTTFDSQYAWRSQRSIGVYAGPPSYESLTTDTLDADFVNSSARALRYSPNGSLLAAAFDSAVLLVTTSSTETGTSSAQDNKCRQSHVLPVEKVVDLQFSPRGTWLSTWQRPYKDQDGNNERNLKSETAALRLVSGELQVFDPAALDSKGVIGRLKLEGMTSYEIGPGEKPSVAVFCGEKKGAPASVRVYSLASLIPTPDQPPAPISQKTFFKADKIQIKWNTAGTALLFLTSTDVDKTGKSYYGETNLYMMSTRGDFDCRVALDKEGPVHDFEWNPNCREFVVIYGYMPAKTTLFSYRVNVIAELGTASRNVAAFNPQGRLLLIAGFGNLSGTVDIWDREKLGGSAGTSAEANAAGKLHSFDGSNSSVCQWSPDGQFILTATLSPRLRVDNGVRIWHCTGQLVHLDLINELYHASWRPLLASDSMERFPFPKALPPAPTPSPAAQTALEALKAKASRPTGAYRPPGARGQPTSDVFQKAREEAYANGNGSSLPTAAAPMFHRAKRAESGACRVLHRPLVRNRPNSSSRRAVPRAVAAPTTKRRAQEPRRHPLQLRSCRTTRFRRGRCRRQCSGDGRNRQEASQLEQEAQGDPGAQGQAGQGEKLEQTQLQKIETEASLREELANSGVGGDNRFRQRSRGRGELGRKEKL
ncbi:hypothetical protein L7F22_011856 [Adiantum nelumboides]|nr:hypothetical protein [Adiantum nelumboides]